MQKTEQKEVSLDDLTPFERRMMVQHRVSWIFWGVAHQFHTASRVTRLLKLTNGDSALMMAWFGLAGSCNNTLSVVISPLVGSLSDAVGRKYLVAAGRMGTGLFFLSTIMAKTMRQQCVPPAPSHPPPQPPQ